jgi:hypothetical protein
MDPLTELARGEVRRQDEEVEIEIRDALRTAPDGLRDAQEEP